MFSRIDPTVLYPVSPDITEHDINIVSDLWTMAGRQVYRGARDSTYTHANVYWLYDPDDLDRVGLAEHRLEALGDVELLWYRDNPFGTLLQEDGWTEGDSLWSKIPAHVYERYLAEGWTGPAAFLERCLHGQMRVVTTHHLIQRPSMYICEACCVRSLSPIPCSDKGVPLDYPSMEKMFCIDDRMIVHIPPAGSSIWSRLGFTSPPPPRDEPSSEPQEADSAEEQPEASESDVPPPQPSEAP